MLFIAAVSHRWLEVAESGAEPAAATAPEFTLDGLLPMLGTLAPLGLVALCGWVLARLTVAGARLIAALEFCYEAMHVAGVAAELGSPVGGSDAVRLPRRLSPQVDCARSMAVLLLGVAAVFGVMVSVLGAVLGCFRGSPRHRSGNPGGWGRSLSAAPLLVD